MTMARRLLGSARRLSEQERRAAPGAPALSSGLFWLPHLGDWTHDGQPSAHSQARDRVAGRGQPVARPRGSRARRSRRRPGARRRRRRSAGRCRRAARSRRRRCPSGRRSRTAAAGRSSSARRRARRRAGRARRARTRRARPSGTVHQTALGAQRPLGQVERLLAEHLADGWRRAQERHHLVGHLDLAEGQPALAPAPVLALRDDRDVGDLAGRGGVVGVGRARSSATCSSRSSDRTSQVSPRCT